MRHGDKVKKLGRAADHRSAMLNNLATSILVKGLAEEQMNRQVKTTVQKAKAVRSLVERLITYAKKGDLSAKRQAAKFVKNKEAFKGLFEVLGDRYKERNGGYTRILKLSEFRHGDNAALALISLVEDELQKKPKKKKKKSGAKAAGAKTKAKATEEKQAEDSAEEAEAKTEAAEEAKAEDVKAEEAPATEAPAEEAKAEEKAEEPKAEEKAEEKPKAAKKKDDEAKE